MFSKFETANAFSVCKELLKRECGLKLRNEINHSRCGVGRDVVTIVQRTVWFAFKRASRFVIAYCSPCVLECDLIPTNYEKAVQTSRRVDVYLS